MLLLNCSCPIVEDPDEDAHIGVHVQGESNIERYKRSSIDIPSTTTVWWYKCRKACRPTVRHYDSRNHLNRTVITCYLKHLWHQPHACDPQVLQRQNAERVHIHTAICSCWCGMQCYPVMNCSAICAQGTVFGGANLHPPQLQPRVSWMSPQQTPCILPNSDSSP